MKMILLGVCGLFSLWGDAFGEESVATVAARLASQVSNSKVTVSNEVLEEIAVLTFRVATAVPEKGLEASRTDMEGLIALRKQLEKHSGVAENLLARRIQEIVDGSVLYEIVREHADATKEDLGSGGHLNGVVQPPFVAGSLKPETVRSLLDQNRVDERARVEFVFNGDSRLAKEFRKSRVTPEEILEGKWDGKLPAETKQSFIPIRQEDFPHESGVLALKDYLLVATFIEIDRARYARLIVGLYMKNDCLPPTWDLLKAAVGEQLKTHPTARVAESMPGSRLYVIGALHQTGDLENGQSRVKRLIWLLMPFVPHLELLGPLGKEASSHLPRLAGLFLREREAVPASAPPASGAGSPKAPKSPTKP